MVLLHPSSSQILLISLPTQLCYYLLSCFKKIKKKLLKEETHSNQHQNKEKTSKTKKITKQGQTKQVYNNTTEFVSCWLATLGNGACPIGTT